MFQMVTFHFPDGVGAGDCFKSSAPGVGLDPLFERAVKCGNGGVEMFLGERVEGGDKGEVLEVILGLSRFKKALIDIPAISCFEINVHHGNI